MQLELPAKTLDLAAPRVMGVLNRTPDSFSDAGAFQNLESALQHALRMVDEGADIIDVGGESTRPGSAGVSVQEELDRVVPLVERLVSVSEIPISIDTSKPEVMRAAVAAGAAMINDVYALRRPGALEAARACAVPVCLMHMQGEPRTMQKSPAYEDVVAEVRQFLEARVQACVSAGIPRQKLVIDPGFGFGKTLAHNLGLLRDLAVLTSLEVPILVGLSRKSMIGALLGNAPVTDRLQGSVVAAVIAVLHGARLVRTHDVLPTVQALRIAAAICVHE
ncbi:MAG: dihydropteroate synthase [Gammaproteobacteria bacterium]|nr:dihydropteroate synthase [Gammaproteobacteria bacterium]